MKTNLFIFLLTFSLPLLADIENLSTLEYHPSNMQTEYKEPSQIIFNNRPLAKVNGKAISLIDVIKKMNIFIYQNAPDLFKSKMSLFQFYLNNWTITLDEIINNELILAEAEEKEVKVSDGDVREEMEERFGPNIMSKLDELNLQYEEARQMIFSELKVRQLIWFKVHAKALQMVTPAVIKTAYKDYLVANPPIEEWEYQVLSIRGKNQTFCEELANEASSLLHKQDFDFVSSHLKEKEETKKAAINVTLSENYRVDSKSISSQHKEVLSSLSVNSFSPPTSQFSRFDNSTVYRIFYLKSYSKKDPQTFYELSEKIKEELQGKAIDQEKQKYITHLEKRFDFDRADIKKSLPENYLPFAIN